MEKKKIDWKERFNKLFCDYWTDGGWVIDDEHSCGELHRTIYPSDVRAFIEDLLKEERKKARGGVKHLGAFMARGGDELCEVLKIGNIYYRSWDLEAYKSGIRKISEKEFLGLSKLNNKK